MPKSNRLLQKKTDQPEVPKPASQERRRKHGGLEGVNTGGRFPREKGVRRRKLVWEKGAGVHLPKQIKNSSRRGGSRKANVGEKRGVIAFRGRGRAPTTGEKEFGRKTV